jgi:hypothetical protein
VSADPENPDGLTEGEYWDAIDKDTTASLGVPLVPVEPNPCEACPHSYVGAEACKTCTGPESQHQGEQ